MLPYTTSPQLLCHCNSAGCDTNVRVILRVNGIVTWPPTNRSSWPNCDLWPDCDNVSTTHSQEMWSSLRLAYSDLVLHPLLIKCWIIRLWTLPGIQVFFFIFFKYLMNLNLWEANGFLANCHIGYIIYLIHCYKVYTIIEHEQKRSTSLHTTR